MILPIIALRNLSRQKRRSILLGSALSFSMFILILVNGITGGLVLSLQKNFSSLVAGHIFFIQMEKDENNNLQLTIDDDQALMASLADSGLDIDKATRRTVVSGTVLYAGKSIARSIAGVDWTEDSRLGDSLELLAGDASRMAGSDGIIISRTLAELLGLLPKQTLSYAERAQLRRDIKVRWRAENKAWDLNEALDTEVERLEIEAKERQEELMPAIIGEEVLVQLSTIHGQQNVASFRVHGIFDAQMDSAYVDREELNAYLEMEAGTYNQFGLLLNDFSNLDAKTAMLHSRLQQDYDLVPLSEVTGKTANTIVANYDDMDFSGKKTLITNLNNELGSFVSILTGVQAGSFGLFLVILLVVMVGLVNTYRIIVYERTREIGTMRALGLQQGQVRILFLLEALFLALGGCVPGALLAIVLMAGLNMISLDTFTEIAYFLDDGHISYTLGVDLFVGAFLLVLIITLLAALLPARRAAALQPAQALRSHF